MNAQTTSCAMPKGIFEPSTDANPSGSMLRMIAFGPEAHIVYPPKPDDVKTPWNPEWSVRIRVKSTAFAPIGMDMGQQDEPQEEGDGKKSNTKKNPARNFWRVQEPTICIRAIYRSLCSACLR